MRPLKVILGCVAVSSLAALLFGIVIGGRLGFAILFAMAFIIIRNATKLMLTAQPFTLDGRPLPVSFYFIPSPTYSGPSEFWIQTGFFMLVMGVVFSGIIGWHLSSASIIAPLHLSGTKIAFLAIYVLTLGSAYGLQIVLVEFRPPPGRPPETEPWLTVILALATLIGAIMALSGQFPTLF